MESMIEDSVASVPFSELARIQERLLEVSLDHFALCDSELYLTQLSL